MHSKSYRFDVTDTQLYIEMLFWHLNTVIKLTKINNALSTNRGEMGVYKVHDLTEQQSISLKVSKL